jgi:hypothetical protein
MPIINHDYKDIDFLEHIIVKEDGTPLHGEIDMYRRIFRNCETSSYHWHFWHDVHLPIPVKGQASIQIDFLLACEKGIVIVEVKGGKVGIRNGVYYLENKENSTNLDRTPFEQADDYMYALINNKVIDLRKVFITTVCAFPHTRMNKTNDNDEMDQGWKLWSSIQQENGELSFADFCLKVIEKDKDKKKIFKPDLDTEGVLDALKTLMFNFSDDGNRTYSNVSLESIIEWLQVDNLRLFDSLRKNQRLVIEGGPGTGKTTLAKAFIKKHSDLRGLYVCWNKLLESKIRSELNKEGLDKCEVIQFASLFMHIQNQLGKQYLSLQDINSGCVEKMNLLLKQYRDSDSFTPYNYIILDEAQDILDKGASCLLQNLSFFENGLESGSYLVYYDTEQGYNNKSRQIEGWANQISKHSACFILDENKRVPTNKRILDCAKQILNLNISNDTHAQIGEILEKYSDSITVERCRGAKNILRQLGNLQGKFVNNINDCVILAHSSTQKTDIGESLFDRIATSIGITELTESNVNVNLKGIPFTSILRFKGLESKHVIIVLNSRTYIDSYELYIGMTRAIIDLTILIME